jgi:hypothetical protein
MIYRKNETTNLEKAAKYLIAPAILLLFSLACSLFGGGSPTAVYKSFAGAVKKKDAAAMKKYLSEESLQDLRTAAKSAGKSEDEMLASAPADAFDYTDISNEKIDPDGQSATLDVTTKADGLKTINFVKEGSWKVHYGKPKTKSDAAVKETPADSTKDSTDSSKPAETGPVTISASALIDEAKSSSAGMEKYRGRMMTVTDAELWEIQYSMLHIGAKYGSYYSGYIICSGSFSEYEPYSSKISDLKKQGKSPGATIKGTFSKVVTDSGYTQVHLDPCVLSSLDK